MDTFAADLDARSLPWDFLLGAFHRQPEDETTVAVLARLPGR